MDQHSYYQLTTIILLLGSAILGGLLAFRFRLPLVLGYIIVGVLSSNIFSSYVDQRFVDLLSQVGVTLLLFTLGLEFSFYRLRASLKLVLWPAITQIILCIGLFSFFMASLHMQTSAALFIAGAMSLSSTAVIVKILTEKDELETIPGEITTAWLVIQDLAVIPLMILLPIVALGTQQSFQSVFMISIESLVKATFFIVMTIFLGQRGVPWMLGHAAKIGSRELFLLFTVSLILFAGIGAYVFGLSTAIGAFIAGLMLAETRQNHEIFSEIRPLRDVFAVVFFVTLGFTISLHEFFQQLPIIIGMTIVVIIVKWLVVYGLCRIWKYHRKTAFFVSLALVEMSEFGFVIARVGLGLHALSQTEYITLVCVTIMTLFIASPLLSRHHEVYGVWFRLLGRFWPTVFAQRTPVIDAPTSELFDHIIICGYGRVGKYIGRALDMIHTPFVVVDYNHTTTEAIQEHGMQAIYGDPADLEVLRVANPAKAKAIIVAIPDFHSQKLIIENARALNKSIMIICRTHHEEDQKHLRSLGVQLIIQPEFEASVSIVSRLLHELGIDKEDIEGKIRRLKIEHGVV